MSPTRRTALVAGALYLLTFVSIPTLGLYGAVKGAGYIVGSAGDTAARLGGFLEVVVALASIGTAVVLYPVVRRQNEALALGFVAARILEAAMIFTGVASLLTIVNLRDPAATGAQAATLLGIGESLVSGYTMAFLLGQSLMPGLNALLLGYLLYRSGLVARAIPLIGLIGAPIHLTAVALTFFGVVEQISTTTLLAALPIAAWEFSLGVYLLVKGFRASPLLARSHPAVSAQATAVPVG